MPDPGVADLLARSFALVAHEAPEPWARCRALLLGRVVTLTVDDEALHVRFEEHAATVHPGAHAHAHAHIATTSAAILSVLDDQLTLEEAVLQDRVRAIGRLDTLAACHDALLAYVHAGVRSPGMPLLLGAFRARVTEARSEHRHQPTG